MLHKRLSPAAWLGLSIATPLALAAALAVLPRPDSAFAITVFYAALAAVMVLSFSFVSLHWKALDEAGRTAHRHAWYWGGTFGLVAALLLAAIAAALPAPSAMLERFVASLIHSATSPVALAFVLGVAFAALVQMAFYLVAWLRWWGARRGGE